MAETEAAILCTGSLSKTLTRVAAITKRLLPEAYLAVLAEIQIPALLTEAAVHIQMAEAHIPAADHPVLHTPAPIQAADTVAEVIQAEAVTVAADIAAAVAAATQAALLPEDKSEI